MSSFTDLEKCVQANISAPSNDIRLKAETHLKELKNKYPEQFFQGICQLIQKSNDLNVRSFAAVLLKQSLGIFDDTFFKLPINSRNNIKQLLLAQIKSESNPNALVQIAEAVSYLMCLIAQNTNYEWKALMPFLFNLSKSNQASERAAFYITIDKLACNAMDTLRCSNMQSLRDTLIAGLQDKQDIVRENALSAVVTLLCAMNEEQELNYFMNIVPLLFNNININIGDQTICKTCQNLQMLAENQPNFFINSMKPIIECLVNVTKCSQLEWDTRKLSMNLLITLLNYHYNQIQNILIDVAKQVIPLIFDFLSTFNADLEWNSPDDDAEQYNYQFGAEILPDIVNIFGAEIFLNITKPVFDIGFADNTNDWKKRLIALKTVEVTLESCCVIYEQQLNQIVHSTWKSLSSSSPYVQYAAASVIKQLSVIFGDDNQLFLIPFSKPIMNTFCNILNDYNSHHRCVIIQLCDALAHFAYIDEENEVMSSYSSLILKALYNVVSQSRDNLIQSYALKAISVICSVIQDEFKEFYPILMKYCTDLLQQIFKGQVKDINGSLRGRVMECIAGMLLVVDIDLCRQDAHNVIKFLLPFQKQEQANDSSESYTFMMALFAAIAEALTNEFTPYISQVIPPLLQSAQKRTISVGIHNKTISPDTEQKSGYEGDKKLVTEEYGGIQFRVNTAELNEKITAIQQFPRYAVCLEGELLQFVKPISSVLQPIIKTRSVSSEARRHAIETMSPLVNCLKCGLLQKGLANNECNKWITEFVQEILPSIIEAMNSSDQVDEFSLCCKTIQDLLDYIDVNKFKNADLISDITEQIQTAIQERQVRREINEEQSMDLIDADVEEDVEADLADTIVDLVTKLVSIFGVKYVSIFDKCCGKVCIDLLNVKNEQIAEADQILALSMLTELIRYGGQESNKYIQAILNISQNFLPLTSISAPLKQSICYAIGICAEKKCLNANNISNWLGLLKTIVDDPNARNDDNIDATENAISAIGKILKSYSSDMNNAQSIIIEWIQMLPLMNDVEEREFCNEYLLSILQKTGLLNDIMQQKNIKMIAKLIQIMAVSITNDDKVKPQYQQLFTHLKAKCDANLIQQSISGLNNDLQAAFY